MNVISAGYEILTPISEGGIEELKRIEQAARICYKSEHNTTDDGESAKTITKALIKRQHFSALEHSSLSVKFITSRSISHQIVRHRLASFNQMSQRYVNYADDKFMNEITFINPFNSMKIDGTDPEKAAQLYAVWYNTIVQCESDYFKLISMGAKPEVARNVLPNSVMTEIIMTANYREWRHFFKLRAEGVSGKPDPAMREITIPLLQELKSKLPIIFDDIVGG